MGLSLANLIKSSSGVYNDDASNWTDLDLLAAAANAVLYSGWNTQSRKNQELVNLATVAIAQVQRDLVFAFNDLNLEDRKENPMTDLSVLAKKNPQELAVKAKFGRPEPAEEGSEVGFSGDKRKGTLVTEILVRDRNTRTLVKQTLSNKFKKDEVVFDPKAALKDMVQNILFNDALTTSQDRAVDRLIMLTPSDKAAEHAEMRLVGYCWQKKFSLAEIGVSKPCCHMCAEALDEADIKFTRWSIVKGMKTGWIDWKNIDSTKSQEVSMR